MTTFKKNGRIEPIAKCTARKIRYHVKNFCFLYTHAVFDLKYIYTFLIAGHVKMFKNHYPRQKFDETGKLSVPVICSIGQSNECPVEQICSAQCSTQTRYLINKHVLTDLIHLCYITFITLWPWKVNCLMSQNWLVTDSEIFDPESYFTMPSVPSFKKWIFGRIVIELEM